MKICYDLRNRAVLCFQHCSDAEFCNQIQQRVGEQATPNSPSPSLLGLAEHLIYDFLMKFIILMNEHKYRKRSSL